MELTGLIEDAQIANWFMKYEINIYYMSIKVSLKICKAIIFKLL